MKEKKTKTYLKRIALIAVILTAIVAVIIKYDLFYKSSIEELNLTTEQKLEDFDQFYTIITTSFPNLEEVEKAYGFDFEEKCDEYRKMIEESEDDFEFYCIMHGIARGLGSFHTDMVFPYYENVKNCNYYNAENVVNNKKFKVISDYWYGLIEKECKARETVKAAEFRYINGKYFMDPVWSDASYDVYNGYYIVSIGGKDVDVFIKENLSVYQLQYDLGNNKGFRDFITLNDSEGECVTVCLQSEEGDVVETNLYISLEVEVAKGYIEHYLLQEQGGSSDAESVLYHYSESEDILYVQINDFGNQEGKKLKDIFKLAGENTQIIIDLRDNYGGYPYYGKENIYPYLYSGKVSWESSFLMPNTKYNAEQNYRWANKIRYGTKKQGDSVLYSEKIEYKGKKNNYKQNVYYLVNDETGSAADGYVAMIKQNKLGTIVGTNTGGEGFGSSCFLRCLENSNLPFIYFPSEPNTEELNNAVYGTPPDKYIYQSVEGFYKRCDMRKQGVDVYTYENRLFWDNVLVETMKMGKE